VDWLKEEFRDVKYGYENKAALGNLFSKNVKTLQEVKGKTRLTNEQLREYLKQKEKIISSLSSYSIPVEDLESQLMSRNNELKETSAAFKDVSRYLALPQNEQIPHVVIRLKQIQAAYGRFQEAQKVSSESKRRRKGLTDKIESTQNKITLAKGKKELAETAIEALNDILNNESKEKHLQTFLHQNKIEITEIFKDIHSPREFSDLDFQSSPIHLVRESNKHHDPISKISSGQRAALALSIFLTLNQKLIHGPPYLFFDDPVAFVDDLNTLSFLDFLREIAISGSRQIFFATASQKIASLFAKKFEFLAGDFKQHTLAR
jgi:DNA repair exonuclease SbcCD ATPase subunit